MTNPAPTHQEFGDEFELPCAEAILAGTLALMTAHAQADCAGQRHVMRARIVSHLGQLAGHSLLSPAFRTALGQLRGQWERLPDQHGTDCEREAWHPAPGTLQ